ncbi:exodeoxyribonuclease VII large subunit, partial [Patescibacteria group bacterium]|nr:exodeoxyribonuclease VII large subunit [Patescibacteria group bacterium]
NMDDNLLQKLKEWRRIIANNEGIDLFRVLQNKVIESIATLKPRTKEELMAIKGIRERKFNKYGEGILALVNKETAFANFVKDKPYTVSNYLDLLNNKLSQQEARVQGEISSLEIRENYLFFSLKDRGNESVLRCFMGNNDYKLCGISFEEGMEIIVDGFPEIYKPNGRFSFQVSTAELVGEGTLKKAYNQLKKKLEAEGLFSPERKKPIPEFSQKIGLITSETSAVIHDFLTNLGRYGYQIQFVDSRVEGQSAVRDLLSAINYFSDKDIDILVIIRGGGSLESLQAFNNEILVRKIADFNVPVICGIGHEKDVPLASLVADLMVSTPSIAAVTLNKSWEKALSHIKIFEQDIINKYQQVLSDKKHQLEIFHLELKEKADFIFEKFETIKRQLNNKLETISYVLKDTKTTINRFQDLLFINFQKKKDRLFGYLERAEERLRIVDPVRQLKLGYSIASLDGKIIKSIRQVQRGDKVDILVSDGKIKSQVNDINNK